MMMQPSLEAVLHPTDLSPESAPAFAHALALALASSAEMAIVHAISEEKVPWSEMPGVREVLERWGVLDPGSSARDVLELGLRVIKEQRRGSVVASILGSVSRFGPDMVVLSTHSRTGWDALVHGRVAEPVARRAHVPALLLPPGVDGFINPVTGVATLRRVVVPAATEPAADAAVFAVNQLIGTLKCAPPELIAVHVGEKKGAPSLDVPEGWDLSWKYPSGPVVEGIVDTARGVAADLIAMTTDGHDSLMDALRGSTVERVVRVASCPVLIVPW
jgi:nucleotide-binding universal stress UspA family protein